MQRSTVSGSCVQSVGTAASVLFAVINRCGHISDTSRDCLVTRQAKILYISLLESVQKERGEWQGFSLSSTFIVDNKADNITRQSPRDLLTSSINLNSTTDQLDLLSEIMEVSLRNLMGPLVPCELYARQKKVFIQQSMAIPPTLSTLLAIRDIFNQLERDVQHCLLRLFALWDLIALVNGDSQPLLKTIAENCHHIFSESSEVENRTARKSERQDVNAINLVLVMVLYRDLFFSDIEFILTKQELQIDTRLVELNHARGWPAKVEPVPIEEDDRLWSDSDIGSTWSDENQVPNEETATNSWKQHTALNLFRFHTSSEPSSLHDEGQDNGIEGRDWSVSWPCYHDEDRKTLRSRRSFQSLPMSGGADPLASPLGNDNIPPSRKMDLLTLERIPSGRRRSQRSLASTLNSPTPSAISQASSSTRSTSQKAKLQTRRGSSFTGRIDLQRFWQDTTRSNVRSTPRRSRSMNCSKSTHRIKNGSAPRVKYSTQMTDQTMQEMGHQVKGKTKIAATPRYPSIASALVIPVVAATLCVVATLTTLAIYEMRRASRN